MRHAPRVGVVRDDPGLAHRGRLGTVIARVDGAIEIQAKAHGDDSLVGSQSGTLRETPRTLKLGERKIKSVWAPAQRATLPPWPYRSK